MLNGILIVAAFIAGALVSRCPKDPKWVKTQDFEPDSCDGDDNGLIIAWHADYKKNSMVHFSHVTRDSDFVRWCKIAEADK